MRIAFCTNAVALGGAERAILSLAEYANSAGFSAEIWSLGPDPPHPRLAPSGVSTTPVRVLGQNTIASRLGVRALAQANAQFRPDVTIFVLNPPAAALQRLLFRKPTFYWVQNLQRPTRVRALELAAWAIGVRFVALNRSVRRTVPLPRVAIIGNPYSGPDGVDVATVHLGSWSHGRILSVGRCVPQKALHHAISMMVHLEAAWPGRFQLDLVGDGPLRLALEQQARRLKVDHRVTFHGAVPADQFYQCRPILLHTADYEGQGVVLLEAAQHGCPVVARDVPGVRDTLGLDYPALCAAQEDVPGNLAALVRKVSQMTDDDVASLVERLRRRFAVVFALPTVSRRWLALAEDSLRRQSIRSRRRTF